MSFPAWILFSLFVESVYLQYIRKYILQIVWLLSHHFFSHQCYQKAHLSPQPTHPMFHKHVLTTWRCLSLVPHPTHLSRNTWLLVILTLVTAANPFEKSSLFSAVHPAAVSLALHAVCIASEICHLASSASACLFIYSIHFR